MKDLLIRILILIFVSLCTQFAKAQDDDSVHVHWTHYLKVLDSVRYELIITADIDRGYYIFSNDVPEKLDNLATRFVADINDREVAIGTSHEDGVSNYERGAKTYVYRYIMTIRFRRKIAYTQFSWRLKWTECRFDSREVVRRVIEADVSLGNKIK